MTFAKEIIAETERAGGCASSIEPVRPLLARMWAKFTKGCDNVADYASIHDPRGWWFVGLLAGEREVMMAVEGHPEAELISISSGRFLTTVLGETPGFVFYVFDADLEFVICFNDHDVLITVGSASQRMVEVRAGLQLLARLQNGVDGEDGVAAMQEFGEAGGTYEAAGAVVTALRSGAQNEPGRNRVLGLADVVEAWSDKPW